MKKLIALFNQKKFEDLIEVIEKNYLKKNTNTKILNLFGLALQGKGEIERSIKIFTKLSNKDKDNYQYLNNLGSSYYAWGDYFKAETCFKKSIFINPKYLPPHFNLAKIKIDLNQIHDSINVLLKALDNCDPNDKIKILFKIARVYRAQGEFEHAKKYTNKIFELDKNNSSAHKLLNTITDYNIDGGEHLIELERVSIIDNLTPQDKINIYFSLGKAYEQKLNFKKAASYYKKANVISKDLSKYENSELIKLIEDIKSVYNQIKLLKIYPPHSLKRIIFICGMPRSGSTLVEQILSSHNKVAAMGECNYLSEILNKYFLKGNELKKELMFNNFSKYRIDIQNEYLLKNFIKNSSLQVFTDKTLQNFLWIGFIKIFFPNSIIINTEREIKDNAFSIYKNAFNRTLGWTFNETDIINYFKLFKNLMFYWKSELPSSIYTIKYENLVRNTNVEVNKLIKFCNLEFDENCLNFYNNKNTVFTTSSFQVRKKISSRSIDIYKNFYPYYSNFFDTLDNL